MKLSIQKVFSKEGIATVRNWKWWLFFILALRSKPPTWQNLGTELPRCRLIIEHVHPLPFHFL